MDKRIKAAIIGAGSTYTPELMEGMIKRKESLPLGELALMDIDERKLAIVGGLCERMAEAAGLGCRIQAAYECFQEVNDSHLTIV